MHLRVNIKSYHQEREVPMNCSKEIICRLPFLTRFFRATAQNVIVPEGLVFPITCKEDQKCDKNDK